MRHARTQPVAVPLLILPLPVRLALLVVALLLPGALAAQSNEQTAEDRPDAIGLDEIGSGELLWKSEHGLIPLPVADVEVELSVTGMMTRGRLTQRFVNSVESVIEAVFMAWVGGRA